MTDFDCAVWGNNIAVKAFHSDKQPAILALHGWLDNAGSFDRVAQLILNHRILAPDLAGHGLSDYRSPDSAYNLWQDAGDMDQLIRQLDLAPVILMGHSRGAMIANLTAALYPDRVKAVILLDGSMPFPVTLDDTVKQLRNAFEDRRKYLSKPVRYYSSYEDAIQSRLRGPMQLSRQAVACLATRGLAEGKQGFYWRADPRLRGASEVKLTKGHSVSILQQVACPVLGIFAREHATYHEAWLSGRDNVMVKNIDGAHHLHLEDTCGEVASLINHFLEGLEQSG